MAEQELEDNSHADDVEGWRMALLLLGFATVTLILERSLHFFDHLFKSKRGLSIALGHIKDELLFVGSISLLLSAFQDLLAQICIPLSDHETETPASSHRRRLFSGGYTDYCGPDRQSLWPISLQHDTHIFIFVVGCTHIVYGTITVYLTLMRVKRWRKWEDAAIEEAINGDPKVMKMPAKWLYRNVGSNPVIHFFLMLVRQYYVSVNQTLYHNARLMFIEKMGLPLDFNFHDLVVRSMEDELMRTLRPEWHLWLIAVFWYAIPSPAFVSFWMYGISLILVIVIGAKLVDILVQISVQVAIKYGESVVFGRMAANPLAKVGITALGRSSLRASAINSPTMQQRFLDGVTGMPGLMAAGTGGTADKGGAAEGAGRRPLEASIDQLSSREQALGMLRSMASTLSGGRVGISRVGSGVGGSGGAGSGGAAAAAAAGEICEAAPGPEPAPEPATHELAPMATVPQDASGSGGGVGGAGGVLQSRGTRSGLSRGSAPAAVRRQLAGGNVRYTGAGEQAPEGPGRHLSIIKEGSPSHKAPTKHGGGRHHHHHHQHQHQHRQQQDPKGAGRKVTQPLSGPSRPPPAKTGSFARRSVFEIFQRNPDQQHRAASLRSSFHPLPPHGELPQRPQPPAPRSQEKAPKRSQDQALRGSRDGVMTAAPAAAALPAAASAAGNGSRNAGAVATANGSAAVNGAGGAARPADTDQARSFPRLTVQTTELEPQDSFTSPQLLRPSSGSGSDSGSSYSGARSSSRGVLGIPVGRPSVFRTQRTPSGRRRRVPLLLRPCYCGAEYAQTSSQYVKELIQRREARGVHNYDAKEFFWFGKPRFLTALFTLAYFQNSLSIAMCIFSLAGVYDSVSTWETVPTWGIFLQLFLDVCLVPQVSLGVLPLYALIQPLGSHCPRDLLDMAHDEAVRLRMANHKKLRPGPSYVRSHDGQPPSSHASQPAPAKPTFFGRMRAVFQPSAAKGQAGDQAAGRQGSFGRAGMSRGAQEFMQALRHESGRLRPSAERNRSELLRDPMARLRAAQLSPAASSPRNGHPAGQRPPAAAAVHGGTAAAPDPRVGTHTVATDGGDVAGGAGGGGMGADEASGSAAEAAASFVVVDMQGPPNSGPAPDSSRSTLAASRNGSSSSKQKEGSLRGMLGGMYRMAAGTPHQEQGDGRSDDRGSAGSSTSQAKQGGGEFGQQQPHLPQGPGQLHGDSSRGDADGEVPV